MTPVNRPAAGLSVFVLLSAGASAACSSPPESAGPPASSAASVAAGTSTAATKPTGHTGDTLTLTRADGSTIAVTLEQIINPATAKGDSGDPGSGYVATKFTIADPGTTDVDGNVNINVSVSGSDGQTYTPDLNDVNECANFKSGMFHLTPGDSVTGCVVFALPHGVSPAKVRYQPSSGFADDFGEWLLR